MAIHPTAVISKEAEIHPDVEIGPFCTVNGKVRIDSGCRLESHVFIGSQYGIVEIGKNNHFWPCSIIGGAPQDVSYKDQPTKLVIGDRNVFREFSTANIATTKQDGITRIGNDNYIMAYVHIGHDCHLGNNIKIANDSHLAGHTIIEDNVTVGGLCGFNQFVRVGKFAFIAGASVINKDILPFTKAQGNYAICRATNKIGMERGGIKTEVVQDIHKAIRILILSGATQAEALVRIENECVDAPEIRYLLDFVRTSKRGIAK